MLALNQIHCGDNCELMLRMPGESVDLVVTSPPYDNLRTYGGHEWDFYGVAWQLKRLLKPGGVIVWIVADETKDGSETGTSMEQALHFRRLGLNLHDTMIWSKGCFSAVGATSVRYAPSTEFMFVLSKGRPATFNPIRDRKNLHAGKRKHGTIRQIDGSLKKMSSVGKECADMGIRFNVWDIPPESSNTVRAHPAQFPEALARDHITSWTNPGDLVLDPFSGSGTTARAAHDLGRNFIGLEVNPEYCNIARARLAQSSLDINE